MDEEIMRLLTHSVPRAEMGKLTQTEATNSQMFANTFKASPQVNVQVGKYTDISSMEYYDDDESQGESQNSVLPLPLFKSQRFCPILYGMTMKLNR